LGNFDWRGVREITGCGAHRVRSDRYAFEKRLLASPAGSMFVVIAV
jgi:hypothetical protein